MSWRHFFLSGVATWVAALVGANFGSISSIRRGWHAQTIYHRCIMPNVGKVCLLPQTIGLLTGLGAYLLLTTILRGAWLLPSVAALLVTLTLAFLGARVRGKRIYPESVRKEGIVLDDDNVIPSDM